eukprot:gnl/TRDRNA2_/TRDRNA2_80765_c0_seq1.p1 gnl/TRDRNA2_/TRDRNA2_80765_c0~~gnl/TRDRNA2_/TRDRNA2_80765_c0_seq1.p1  ORF type:complete len:665 (-),score=85.36 gnl/TRDRNA2_/TRDRNA2_80765_c0_seq1:73-2067(-)
MLPAQGSPSRPCEPRRRSTRTNAAATPLTSDDGPPVYAVHFDSFEEAKDGSHVEFCLQVTHCSGLSWQTWRRFSAFHELHRELEAEFGASMLPVPPSKSWLLPSWAQALDTGFLNQRRRDLQEYVDGLLKVPTLARHNAMQAILGVLPPEAPVGVRVARRHDSHELEIRPSGGEARPVDGYRMEILELGSGTRHVLGHQVGVSGLQVQRARIGRLASGEHRFTVTAVNLAGESMPVSIDINVDARAPEAPRAPPAEAVQSHPLNGALVGAASGDDGSKTGTAVASTADDATRPATPRTSVADTAAAPAAHAAASASGPAVAPTAPNAYRQAALEILAAPPREAAIHAGSQGIEPTAGHAASTRSQQPGRDHKVYAAVEVSVASRGSGAAAAVGAPVAAAASSDGSSGSRGPSRVVGRTVNTHGGQQLLQPQGGLPQQQPQPHQHHRQHQQPRPQHTQQPGYPSASSAAGGQSRHSPDGPHYSTASTAHGSRLSAQPPPTLRPTGQASRLEPVEGASQTTGHMPNRLNPRDGRAGPWPTAARTVRAVPVSGQGGVDAAYAPFRDPRGAGTSAASASTAATAQIPAAANVRTGGACPAACPADEQGDELRDDEACSVCLSERKTHAFVPCGHRCVCGSCGKTLVRQPQPACPICRMPVEQVLQIFT